MIIISLVSGACFFLTDGAPFGEDGCGSQGVVADGYDHEHGEQGYE